ncbi:hypothetical protein OS190_09265 [Sulfitobacter sp. F26204]|uniref:hypothetical protein n=1 Tax=Sulfitobacter sp. F26204 TaxID=2996014 RepID=UPI00225DF2C1|nr:hypothetical protein [Sulfitobacter sp. F26204]MCX7559755.1 hypothetical protein [Sulfitobacter sp. F26204]
MSKYAVAGQDLKKLLTKSKQKPVNFAYAPGKTPADDYLGMDRIKASTAILKEAKAEMGGKVASGTVTLDGRDVKLTCETLIPNLAKKFKKHLKVYKITFNVIVMDIDGTVLESDLEEQEDDGPPREDPVAGQTGAPVPPPPPPQLDNAPAEDEVVDDGLKGWLTDRLKRLVPEVKKFAAINPVGGPRVVKGMQDAQKLLSKNILDKAEQLIGNLEKLLKVTPPPKAPPMPQASAETVPAPPPTDIEAVRRKLQQAYDQLAGDLEQFLKRAAPSKSGKASQLAAAFRQEITGTDMKKAATLVSALKKFVEGNQANLPALSQAALAKEAVAVATGPAPAERYEQSAGIMNKYPKGANAARTAMDGFAAILGDQPVTDDLIAQAKVDIDAAQKVLDAAKERLAKAQALPDGEAKIKAIAQEQGDVSAAEERLAATKSFEKAAISKKALVEALAFGPLSANSGQSLSDEAAAALITGFTRDPSLAKAALDAASTGAYPDAVALNLAAVIDAKETNFASDTGRHFTNPKFSDHYAKQLLEMGANTGPAFFERMPDYVNSGRQFNADPLQENGITDPAARAQIRSVAVGAALLNSSGEIDTTSQAAKDAIGDLLFNPRSLKNPTPAMNEHVIKTLNTFNDPTTGAKANAVLSDIPDETPANSKTLVRRALRKGATDTVGKADVQKAVLASMLKPLDQGPVGSCFSTAPCRRMRETDPISAMEAYASIAGTGKYKPANGPEVPIVTRIPANEDPIMRSWEYSMATSTARAAGSNERDRVKGLTNGAMNSLGGGINDFLVRRAKSAGGIKGFAKGNLEKLQAKGRLKELKKKVSEEVDLVYDPNSTIVAASDGKSSTGRYVLRRKDNGNDITTPDAFGDYIADQAIEAYGIDPTSQEASDLRDLCKEPAFLDSMKSGDTAPWAMSSGGQTTAATQTLFGKGLKDKVITARGATTDDTADRTEQILTDLLGSFDGSDAEMITIKTVGIHGFNALPNDPSLEPLQRGGKSKLAENIKRELIDRAEAMHDKTYDVDKTGYLYDKIAAQTAAEIGDRTIRRKLRAALVARRPTVGQTPAEINTGILAAITDAKPHFPPTKADVWERILKANATGKTQTAIIQDEGAPEFVIADSNWGSSTSHTFFVVAPDPISGEMAMFEKTIPPGSLRPSDRDWTDAKWAAIK